MHWSLRGLPHLGQVRLFHCNQTLGHSSKILQANLYDQRIPVKCCGIRCFELICGESVRPCVVTKKMPQWVIAIPWLTLYKTYGDFLCHLIKLMIENMSETRKSSCVNARGIPTAAYQVLLGGVTPPPHWGTPGQVWQGVREVGYPLSGNPLARSDRGYPRWGTPIRVPPQSGLMGVPEVGYPPSGYPSPLPHLDLTGVPPRLDLAGIPPPQLDLAGVPPPSRCGQTDEWMDGQTRVKT